MRIVLDSAVLLDAEFGEEGEEKSALRVVHSILHRKVGLCLSGALFREYLFAVLMQVTPGLGSLVGINRLFSTGKLPKPLERSLSKLDSLAKRASFVPDGTSVAPALVVPDDPSVAEMIRVAYGGDAEYIVTRSENVDSFPQFSTINGNNCQAISASDVVQAHRTSFAWKL